LERQVDYASRHVAFPHVTFRKAMFGEETNISVGISAVLAEFGRPCVTFYLPETKNFPEGSHFESFEKIFRVM